MRHRRGTVSISLIALGLTGFVVLSAYGYSVATGKFTVGAIASAAPRTIDTGLSHVRSILIIVRVPKSAVQRAYTTDQIQGDMPGTFLNGDKWEKGLSISGGSFTLSHAMFKLPRATYYWEAHGD